MTEEPKKEREPGRPYFDLSAEENLATFSVGAVWVNRIYSLPVPGGFRIAFGEQHDPMPLATIRTAVVINYWDAVALRDLLTLQIDHISTSEQDADASTGQD